MWGAQADSCNQYLQKGRGVLIEGRLKLDTWVDNDGQKRSKHSVVADRVTFMPSSTTQSETNFDFGQTTEKAAAPVAAAPEAEKAAAKPAKPKKAKAAKTKAPSSGEVNFKDQEPFEDDLPF